MKTKPNLRSFELVGRDDAPFTFVGVRLGHGSSERDQHNHETDFAPRRVRCSACRWFEVAIYRRYSLTGVDLETDPNRPQTYPVEPVAHDYVVHTVGVSIVPGETRLSRISVTESAFEVVELLTVRKSDEDAFITAQSARALAQASDLDDGVREAYVNRAVI